jgi:hypothetical protein
MVLAEGIRCASTRSGTRSSIAATVTGAHAHGVTDLLLREGLVHAGEDPFDPLLRARRLSGWSSGWLVDDLQGERWGIGLKRKQQSIGAGGAMFDAELQLLTAATQIKI